MFNLSPFCIILMVFLFFAIVMFSRLDSDIESYLYEKYGKSAASQRGKVCWITGASSGIGKELAILLAENGVRLVISGTNEQRLQEVKRLCVVVGLKDSDVLVICFDIKDTDRHQNLLKEVLQHFHRLDILVLNAGRAQKGAFVDIDIEVDRQLFDINVFGLISLTRAVLRYFIENQVKGQFVITSSGAGKFGLPFSSSYSASKHALHGYFESLRTEIILKGISITMACPGPVVTPLVENMFSTQTNKMVELKSDYVKKVRMTGQRCARLMASAMANSLREVWICRQPILLLYYLNQYFPTITAIIVKHILTEDLLKRLS